MRNDELLFFVSFLFYGRGCRKIRLTDSANSPAFLKKTAFLRLRTRRKMSTENAIYRRWARNFNNRVCYKLRKSRIYRRFRAVVGDGSGSTQALRRTSAPGPRRATSSSPIFAMRSPTPPVRPGGSAAPPTDMKIDPKRAKGRVAPPRAPGLRRARWAPAQAAGDSGPRQGESGPPRYIPYRPGHARAVGRR